jgi:hypothetical protein
MTGTCLHYPPGAFTAEGINEGTGQGLILRSRRLIVRAQ